MLSIRATSSFVVVCLVVLGSVERADAQATEGLLVPALFDAQVPTPAGPPPTPRHTGVRALLKDIVADVAHLPSKENAIWLGVGGGLALATHPADRRLNQAFRGNDAVDTAFKPGQILGQSVTLFGAALTTYVVGRARDQPKVSHVGMDLIEAVVISEGLTQITKHATRRERPDGSGRTSFPSGHAADTFAFATALERHLGWRGAVPAYMFASYVAISRLPANRHWFSDVMMGAAVGIISGRTVTRHGSKYPFALSPLPGGAMLTYAHVGH
jgi:membrane-associated phospholipid phosphatase